MKKKYGFLGILFLMVMSVTFGKSYDQKVFPQNGIEQTISPTQSVSIFNVTHQSVPTTPSLSFIIKQESDVLQFLRKRVNVFTMNDYKGTFLPDMFVSIKINRLLFKHRI